MLSIIIPSYKDPLLHRTIDSLLDNSEGDIEIIPVIDGYNMKKDFRGDPRIKPIFLEKNVGMRNAINHGVSFANGEYLMRTDEHCMFGKGYDKILTTGLKDNWIVVPRRFKLDTEKWKPMDIPPIDYEKLVIAIPRMKFASIRWRTRERDRADIMVDETMAMQGSCWVMTAKHWNNVIVELDGKYGTHYQDSVEMVFKTWKVGGRLMVNKNTWYAHKHRKFKRTHNYDPKLADATFKYSLELWRDYFINEVLPKWGFTSASAYARVR